MTTRSARDFEARRFRSSVGTRRAGMAAGATAASGGDVTPASEQGVRQNFDLLVAASFIVAFSATGAAADEASGMSGPMLRAHKGNVGYTEISPRPIDTILYFLRQASFDHPVAAARSRLKEIIERLDADKAVARMAEPVAPDHQHPFARVVVEADGTPAIEYSLVNWTHSVRGLASDETVEGLKDLTVAATLHGWEHFRLGHELGGHPGKKALAIQESEVWQSMMVEVLAPGRKEHRFVLSEKDDEQTYNGLLCFAAAESKLDHPAWKAFLRWVTSPDSTRGVRFCRDVERRKSERL